MAHSVTLPSLGLQAVILCGPGSSFPTFTSNPDKNPKALLPIANRPMVWYPLDFSYRSGVTDITLICPPSAIEAITEALNTNPHLTSLPLPRPDVLAPVDLDLNTGTAEILRLPEVKALIRTDFIVLPCDLVCELGGEKLLQAWMLQAADLSRLGTGGGGDSARVAGGLGVWYDTKANPLLQQETDFIAVAPRTLPTAGPMQRRDSLLSHLHTLLLSMSTDSLKDLLEEKKGLPVRRSLLRRHPKLRILTSHRDAHIYIFPHWVIDFVGEHHSLETIGEDLVGWWAKAGWQSSLAMKLGLGRRKTLEGVAGSDQDQDTEPHTPQTVEKPTPATDFRTYNPLLVSDERFTDPDAAPTVLAYLHPSTDLGPLIRRVDSAPLLLATSLLLAKLPSIGEVGTGAASPFSHARKVADPDGLQAKTSISRGDCLLAENVTVEGRASIRESVVGARCQIGQGAKLLQCLLMDGAVVGSGCKLTRCVLGTRCVIGEECVLTDCEVQENLIVERKTEEKGSKLMSSEGLVATEDEIQDFLLNNPDHDLAPDEER